MLLKKRSRTETIEKAVEGLPRDSNGRVELNKPITYDYNLMCNNCEYFATRCRYSHGKGFSVQAFNPLVSSTLGTIERTTSAVRDDMAKVMKIDKLLIIVKSSAAVIYGASTAVGWTAYGAKTVSDAHVELFRTLSGLSFIGRREKKK